uniref:Uncharacterized protein n=1 Tax=Brassica campestris TaxID=3711 RepID=M4E4U0_BRACM
MLKPNELVPEIDNVPDNTQDSLSTEDNKNHDLDQEKLLSSAPNSCTHRSHFGWLRRIFSPSKATSSPAPIPDPKIINSSGERMFKTWREALELYDRAIELSPKNWEEAIKLDPQSAKARHGLGMTLLRLGHVDEAMKLVEEASYNKYDLEWVKRVKSNLNNCIFARRRCEWNNVLKEISAPLIPEPHACPEFFVKSQINLALERYKDAAEDAAKALEIEPHNTEIKILKKNVELIQRALSSSKLEKWSEAVRDFEIVHQALPYDKVIAKYLSQAQVALKQSRSEVVLNMESGGDLKEISSLEEFVPISLSRLSIFRVREFSLFKYT